jgi:hypothetical protein
MSLLEVIDRDIWYYATVDRLENTCSSDQWNELPLEANSNLEVIISYLAYI